MKKLLLLLQCWMLCSSVNAGVYRHDVDVKKYRQLAAEPQFACAGQVIRNSGIVGSCVLIGDRYVLCAAHVFVDNEEATPDTSYINGNKVIMNRPTNLHLAPAADFMFRFKREWRTGKVLVVHPVYKDSLKNGHCDMAIIELDEPITDIQPAILNTTFDEQHCVATGVGWGASGKANEPENVAIWFEEIAGQNMIDSIGGYKYKGKPTELLADFDAPAGIKGCNKYGNATPVPLEYMTSGGDSGGGLFRQKHNKWELIGICTGGGVNIEQLLKTGYYGQLGAWTRVSVFNDWILQVLSELNKQR